MNQQQIPSSSDDSGKYTHLSVGDLAKIYRVDRRTLSKWLKPFEQVIGIKVGRFYSIQQVQTIIARLGQP
jgi:hypothetical protein